MAARDGDSLIQPLLEGLEGEDREDAYKALVACNFVSGSDDLLRFLCAFKILARTAAKPTELQAVVEELRQVAPVVSHAARETSRNITNFADQMSSRVRQGEDQRLLAIDAAKRELGSTANFLQSLHETVAQRIDQVTLFNKVLIFASGAISGVLLTVLVSCHH